MRLIEIINTKQQNKQFMLKANYMIELVVEF